MDESETFARSPELMRRDDTGLLVVDVQERLVPAIRDHARVVWKGDEVTVEAGDEVLRFLLVSGKPLGKPVAWRTTSTTSC